MLQNLELSDTIYLAGGWATLSAVVYILGHPESLFGTYRNRLLFKKTSGPVVFVEGRIATLLAHSVQVINFLVNSVPRPHRRRPQPLHKLYRIAVKQAFESPARQFLSTGAPHGRALYPRNLAWFYPDLLNPNGVLSEADARARIKLLSSSLTLFLSALETHAATTTLVPLTRSTIVPVNYNAAPSDSLLGVLHGVEQLTTANTSAPHAPGAYELARNTGSELLARYTHTLTTRVLELLAGLRAAHTSTGTVYIANPDAYYSPATDARHQKNRFVNNANIWATWNSALRLGLPVGEAIQTPSGLVSRFEYKRSIFALFGTEGFIADTPPTAGPTPDPALAITLDSAHTLHGFWDFSNQTEAELFARTADIIMTDARFHVGPEKIYAVSVKRPPELFINRIFTPSYQGRSAWLAYNVEFASRLHELGAVTRQEAYTKEAKRLMRALKATICRVGMYAEVINSAGAPYRTWAYRSANASSWFARFISAYHSIVNEDPLA